MTTVKPLLYSNPITMLLCIFLYLDYDSCAEYGIAYSGHDIEDHGTNSWQECAELCTQHSSCQVWSWYLDKWCWLKSSSAERREDTTCISGPFTCTNEC